MFGIHKVSGSLGLIVIVIAVCSVISPVHASTSQSSVAIQNYSVEFKLRSLKLPVGQVDGRFDEYTKRALCEWRELTSRRVVNRKLPFRAERAAIIATKTMSIPVGDVVGLNLNKTCQAIIWIEKAASHEVLAHPSALLKVNDSQGRAIRAVFPASSGSAAYGTPNGYFKIDTQVDRWQESTTYPGAWMYRPKYFLGGRAFHGSVSDSLVTTYPASHGCVRMPHDSVNQIWRAGLGIGTRVRVYGAWIG